MHISARVILLSLLLTVSGFCVVAQTVSPKTVPETLPADSGRHVPDQVLAAGVSFRVEDLAAAAAEVLTEFLAQFHLYVRDRLFIVEDFALDVGFTGGGLLLFFTRPGMNDALVIRFSG